MSVPKVRLLFTDDELRVTMLALWTYLDALEGDYDDNTVTMELLHERLRQARGRLHDKL